jgi:hypothetical protein
MATWADVITYVRSTYKIADEKPDAIKLVFEVGGLRTQVVMLWHLTLAGGREEWVQIESPIGNVGTVDLRRALDAVGDTVCGGLGKLGDLVTFRHAVPLANININELEVPLALVTSTADDLERSLVGGDQY